MKWRKEEKGRVKIIDKPPHEPDSENKILNEKKR